MGKISKILIANRGEIACRVIHTARRLGVKTVAVYSDADRFAPHVNQADESYHIGASPAAESYLVIEKIIEACRETKADAVHPGYGFLSENPAFVRACDAAGIIFMGPRPESMEAMGLKDAAKKLMSAAGVPVTPGYHGEDQDPKVLQGHADKIGYPVLIKAVAGGGGKGMRKVDKKAEFLSSLESCQREASSSFGDDRVLIEKYILSPRHIEVQIFGDSHGNIIHLFERDCSLQRRHQKVIEEAPAPGMSDDVRAAITKAATEAARAVNYVGAGTVEFIVDGSNGLKTDGFWFMEMNTRLQVEHPVTEEITGLDLVEWQIRVANGEKLPKQSSIKMRGHAIEARLYAEDPQDDFLPSVGPLQILRLAESARIDTGVKEGGEVSIFYDPMISKIIIHKDDRLLAIKALETACRNTHVFPIKTNARFMAACLAHKDFQAGKVSTHFIPQNADELLEKDSLSKDLASLSHVLNIPLDQENTPFNDAEGWRLNQPNRTHYYRRIGGEPTKLSLTPDPTDISENLAHYSCPQGELVFVDGLAYLSENSADGSDTLSGGNNVVAPMPGRIISVNISVGGRVKAGDPRVVMEAMKMETTLEAPRDGVVKGINTSVDALVSGDAVLIELEEKETA